jgi:hypothetical protein
MVYSAIGSDPGWSNFPIKPFFAPLFFRTIDHIVQGEGAVLNTHTLSAAHLKLYCKPARMPLPFKKTESPFFLKCVKPFRERKLAILRLNGTRLAAD